MVTEYGGRRGVLLAAACLLLWTGMAWGQISPGELSRPHSSLEGMGKCTQCHSLGKAIANDNCLRCHTELRSRMNAGTGYHGRLASHQCVECHKEHHGRDFSIVRMDEKAFDHDQAGYHLEGKHAALRCRECHAADRIIAPDVRQNELLARGGTYLGLSRECASCHKDVHRAQLGNQCRQCHGSAAWRPAPGFVHDRARFRLTGKHAQVPCARCHGVMADDHITVKYAGVAFDRCSSCHTDPHKGRFVKPCESCHTTSGWNEERPGSFDHATTRFPLRGLHAALRCEACHASTQRKGGKGSARDFAVKNFSQCRDCHADPHRGEFALRPQKGACEECHGEQGFAPSRFDHATARYALEGKHARVECRRCHELPALVDGRRVPPDFRVRKFQQCGDCHAEAHGGQFSSGPSGGKCESCHTTAGFLPASFGIRDHAQSRFPLAGGHTAVPCAQCHPVYAVQGGKSRQFLWARERQCEDCHTDPHGSQFRPPRYEGCASCHTPQSWQSLLFSHEKTDFPLSGKHARVVCGGCHTETMTAGAKTVRRYVGVPTQCVACHPQAEGRMEGNGR